METTYVLVDERGQLVRMKRTKEPFVYTTQWTAEMGRKFLQKRRKARYKVLAQ